MDKPKTPSVAEELREVTRQFEELIKSGRTKRTPAEHNKKSPSRSLPAQRD